MSDVEPILFALGASAALGRAVAQQANLALAAHEERDFEDGEHKARPVADVRERDVYVLHSLYADAQQSGNDKLCRLLFFCGALRDAGARRITAVAPYLCYSRKDRRSKPCDPVTTRYVAALFEAMGVDAVATVDVHNLAAYENAFRCRTEHLEATGAFVAHLVPLLGDAPVTVLSPDAGGLKRAEQLRAALAQALGRDVPIGFMEKMRHGDTVTGDRLFAEVEGRSVVVFDDMISTGTTLTRAAQAAARGGARRVIGAATHGLFADGAAAALADPAFERIVVTDCVPPQRLPEELVREKLDVIPIAPVLAAAITRWRHGGRA